MTIPPPLDWASAGIGSGPDVPADRRVTRDNWRMYPYSRWAFQHARELVPSRGLPRSTHPRPLTEADSAIADIRLPGGMGWSAFLEETYTDAFLVAHRGRIVFEHYANGMTAATPHMGFSITKSIVGLVADQMVVGGEIDPAATVESILPELGGSAFACATIGHLLDMTDGVAFDEDYGNPDALVHRYSAAYWTPAAGQGGMLEALTRFDAREGAPGAQFRYRTPVADVVALVLRRLSGRRLAHLVAERVWEPAGCADEAYMLVDTSGAEIGGTGLNATARDLLRVALWMLEPAQSALLARLRAGGDPALVAAAYDPPRLEASYRSLWWIDHGEPAALSANGVYGQRLWIDPDNALVVVRFGSHPVATNRHTDPLHKEAFAAIRATLNP